MYLAQREDGNIIHSLKRVFNWKAGRYIMSRIAIIILIYYCHKQADLILLRSWRRHNEGLVKFVYYSSCVLIRGKTMDNVQNCDSFTILIYHSHKTTDRIKLFVS
jgi:hypothetical protein